MIKTIVCSLLLVTTLSLSLNHCLRGYTFIFPTGKCVPYKQLCSLNQYYNKKYHTCFTKSLNCKKGQIYDSRTHHCIAISTKCKKGYVFNHQLQHCVKSYVCKPGYYLSPQYQVCQKIKIKCGPNQQFDYATQKCINIHYATSPYQPHLITSGKFKNYVKSYSKLKKVSHHLVPCPVNKPYYQKSSGRCINCPSKYPYFDVTIDRCVKCSFSQYYNANLHSCISQTSIPHYPSTISRIGY